MSDASRDPSQIVAIVGMAGRFPGAATVEQYWSNLCEGLESISRFSAAELEAAGVSPELRNHPRYVGAKSVLAGVESFDAELFGFSPREAELMDPQLRVFLECAWEALERAGCDPERYGKPIGVYAGVSMNTYLLHQLMRNPGVLQTLNALQLRILNDKDFLTTWASYRLNLRGPSMAVQTACSTSLVAVHVACQSLLNFECDAALAGGVAISVPQERGYLYEPGSIYSPDGHCRPFDAAARGTVSGNGAGMVLLKRLEDALADGDPIHALIRGTAINNDGSLKVGYMAPSVDSQAEVIAAAQSLADVEPDTLGFIETHGTGTPLGDPIEIAALTRVFRESTERKGFCALGSVKANIGHLDQAAGVAGLIKASLAVEHGLIPPSLHFAAPNPEIDLAGSPFRIDTELSEWRSNGHPRRAGVSSFGVGGTNAHVVLEQPPHREPSGPSRERQLLVWSARTPTALDAMTRNLGSWLEAAAAREPAARPALADVAWTSQVGRRELAHRRALVCGSLEDAASALAGHQPARLLTGQTEKEGRGVAFLFPGQGAQYPDMGLDLYRSEPIFRAAVDRCCELLAPHLGFDLRQTLYPGLAGEARNPERLAQTAVAQPALFTVEYALARLWMEWGFEPKALLGHSLGEYVAACLAGVFSLADALALVAVRGRLIQSLPPGAMLSVALSEAELAPRLGGRLSLAAVNGPHLCSVSGPEEEVEALRRSLEELGIESRRLHTSHAFHSALMDPILAAFTREVERVERRAPEIPFVSNLTGTWITDREATDPGYWARHLRQTVRFADGAATLLQELDATLLEVGPGRTLATFLRAQAEAGADSRVVVTSLRHARDTTSDLDHLLGALGRLWLSGVRVDWQGFHAGETRRREILPTYPFDRKRYWVEAAGESAPAALATVAEPAAEPVRYDRPAVAAPYQAPRDEVERAITAIWTELLGIRDIGVHDDFFELGGHSLLATRVLSRVRDQLAVELPLRSLFEAPTIAELRERIGAPGPEPLLPPLTRADRDGLLPLSFGQERLWFLDRLEGSSATYNMPVTLEIRGALRSEALAAALTEVVRRHETLRTRFETREGTAVQVVEPAAEALLPRVDLAALPEAARRREVDRVTAEGARRRCDLTRGPLFAATLLRLAPDLHRFLGILHHAVSDGWSIGLFLRELAVLYDAALRSQPSPLAELPFQYVDFAVWQRQWMAGEALDRLLAGWRTRLAGAPAGTELPTDRPYPPVQTFRGETRSWRLDDGATSALRALCQAEGVTLFMGLLALYGVLLHRYSGQEDLVVGTPVAGRNRPELEGLIGLFINTLPLRSDLAGQPTVRQLLGRTREVVLEAQSLSDLSFERLVEDLNPVRDASRPPLFQTLLALQNLPWSRIELEGAVATTLPVESGTAKYELILWLSEAAAGLRGAVEFNTDLFDRATVARLSQHFADLLAAAAASPGTRIADLPLLDRAERAQLLREWNDTAEAVPTACVPRLVALQAERTPDAPAVVFEGRALTYRELALQGTRLARRLRALGVGPEVLVGVAMERSLEMVVAVLGILESGGAYLPLDPAYPADRLAYMMSDSGVRVLLSQEAVRASLPPHSGAVICLDGEGEEGDTRDLDLDFDLDPDSLAYVLYTSGSTGRPKGVQVPHRALTNFLASMRREPGLAERSRLLAVTSLSFDIAALELLLPLLVGGCVELASREEALDGRRLAARLDDPDIATLQATPATWRMLLDAGWEGRSSLVALCGGEALPADLAAALRARTGALWNLYGPTETTVWSAVARIGEGPVSVGRPIANTSIHLLDPSLRPVPLGAPGELCIGGEGLARGYLGRPDLTAERFVPDPFAGRSSGDRLYRTGDLARRRKDGTLELLGRRDHQVKIRGFRIELGEIEAVLASLSQVREAAVLAREMGGEHRLVAYVVLEKQGPVGADGLRKGLEERLPAYMVPAVFVLLDRLPLTPNGKVDRNALSRIAPPPAAAAEGAAPGPFQDPVAEILAGIWEEVLGVESVRLGDEFFSLGGHSLAATRVVSRIQQALGVTLPVRRLFEQRTVRDLAALVRAEQAVPAAVAPPIVPVPRDGALPLSFAQQRLWFLDRLEPESSWYNLSWALRLDGDLDGAALAASLDAIVDRHEALRTTFPEVDGQPVQRIAPPAPPAQISLPVVDLELLPPELREAELARRIAVESARPFDLAGGPLLRTTLVRLSGSAHVLILAIHHIAADGWSIGVFVRELSALYSGLVSGGRPVLPLLPIQCADHAAWQRSWLQGEVLERLVEAWRARLAGATLALDLPTDRPRPTVSSFRGESLRLELSPRTAASLRALARGQGATVFMVLLAAFQTLLHRLSGQEDLVVGSPVAGRDRPEIESLIGVFVNMLALRGDLTGRPSFRTALARARETALESYALQDLPFEQLVEALQPERDLSRAPLFQTLLVLQNAPLSRCTLPRLELRPLPVESRTSRFDLLLSLAEAGDRIAGSCELASDLFDRATVLRWLAYLEALIAGAAERPDLPVAELPMLSAGEQAQLLREWNDTELGLRGEPTTLHQLFTAQAERSPEAVALVFRGASLTYRELDARANRVAHHLRHLGVGPEVIVGVFCERSPDMVVALLAILKAGGAYLPLSPEQPEERLALLLGETAAPVLLTQERLAFRLPAYGGRRIFVDRDASGEWPEWAPDGGASAGNLAYVIYTSGSTGRPKGVAIEHRSAAVLVAWAAEVFPTEELAGVLASTAIYFDLSVFELFVTLSQGGRVFLVENVLELATLDAEGALTLVNTVPSGIAEVLRLEALPASVRTVNLAGEPLKSPLVRQLYGLGSVRGVFNLYGPSEDTTYSTFARIDREDDAPPIGVPVAGTQVRLVDRRLLPVPVGAVGEIYLSGAGLARGYFGQPGLTAERFVPDPFSDRPGDRMYRTGDLARYRTSGALEYLGRIDHQIKLRGFRIELGEIEAVLLRHPQVREAVVAVRREREDDPRLAAYVVPETAEEARGAAGQALADELRRHLQERLPAYMIPSAFVLLEALPLTPNGKVDRKALPAPEQGPEQGRTAAAAVAPRTPVEEVLAEIWSEVLGRGRVSIGEDFFALGGHSLLAVRVLSRIRSTFGVELPLRAVFEQPTIAGLAARIEQACRAERPELPPLVPVPRGPETRHPLSFAQQRLWFLQQLEPASWQYNLPVALRLTGRLRVDVLAAALREIVRRHESLRTTFHFVAGEAVQRIHPAGSCELPVVDLRALAPADREREAERLARHEARCPFDLERGPVLRAALLRLAAEDHVVLATMHHIASDGWSLGVLTRELTALYEAGCAGSPSPLAELPVQYADFALWQRRWLAGEVLERELTYWRAQLRGAPALELPTDRPRPAVQSLRGGQLPFALPADLSAALVALGERAGATLYMTLLAAFQALLARAAGQTDLTVGTPMAGRERLELEGLIGFFANTLVLRADLAGDPTFRELLGRARETVLDAHRHQAVPFEKLVAELAPERDLSRPPLFQAMLVLQNAPREVLEVPGLTLRPLQPESGTSKFDLTLTLSGGPGGIQGGLEYCSDLFDGTTMRRLLERFQLLLAGLAADPERRLSELLVLSGAERRQLSATRPAAPPRAAHEAPRSALEARIVEVWKNLLDRDRIGVHDRLFDLGAHSLLMVQVYVQLRDLLGDRLTLLDLFKYPTIASLVSFLEAAPGEETLELQRGRERSESRGSALDGASRDVAIVGIRGRFPRAQDLGRFWQNLCDGVEAISFFSDEELRARGVAPARLQDPTYVKAGGVLEDCEQFDAAFFGYSPREAEVMDPQQRLFLECSWEALEDAGYDPGRYPGAVGVFAGVSMSWYLLNLFSNPDLLASQGLYQAMIGNDKDFLPTRVSYKLNLRGPSVNVQSACSTSLVAVHLACQSLLNGESDMALAGGVSANAGQGTGYLYSEGGILSPDGHCRAFDAGARGTVAGSGLGVVVLKRLADAVADGDTIRAVIKGSAINNDGSFKVGYTAPSVEGQANVIAEAQAIAGIDPETITYVETHGTGTEVGDPIEIAALTAAWRQRTDKKGFCAIGSVKTNVGHLDAAAGVTGLVKTVLALEAKKIPPSLHFEQPNPKLDLANSPFYVSDRLADWVSEDGPRRAGVSSFGVGGTNAHVVLEEAPERAPSGPSRPLQLLVLSTRSSNLEAATDNLAEHLRSHPDLPLADVAYTLQVGRAPFDHRRILVCRDREDALQALERRDPQRLLTLAQEPAHRRVVFLFPGSGAQYADMGLELYREEPVFRREVDRCLDILDSQLGLDLKPHLYPALVTTAPGSSLSRTSKAMPALFVTEVALAKLWMSWGVQPQALIGHSLGECTAAYLAGVMSLEEALALVALRGRLIETLPKGAMLSVPLPESEVLPLLGERLSIGAINDVAQCVVSGPEEEIVRLESELSGRGLDVHKLHIEMAAHSSLVDPILGRFGDFLRSLDLRAPKIPFVSNVTGTWIRDEEATDPEYWVRQFRNTVRFNTSLETLLAVPQQIFLEMGPGRTLSSFVRRHPRKAAGHEIFTTLRHINDPISDPELTLHLLGRLWLLGQEIDWAGFHAGERRHRVPLPTYPFDRQRYWVERRPEIAAGALARRDLVKKPEVADWFYAPAWRLSAWPVAEPAEEPRTWLLFADACGLGRELADALTCQGHRVVTVTAGECFVRLDDDAYVLDPAQGADYDALLRELQRRGGIPRRIVHLWSVTVDDPAPVSERFDRAQERGFYSLLRLAQALLRHNVTADVQLDVVSNGLQRMDGGDAVCPGKATLLGVCQVLPQEYDCFSCRSIDVALGSGRRTELAGRLLAEISGPGRERAIAYRDRRRWVRTLEPVRVEAPAAGDAPALRERGVYLITGGLGRFGLSYARHLADRVQARLILTGRSALPSREAWPQWLETHGDGDPVSRRIRSIEDLEQRGAEVVTVSADVADEAQMRAVVELARRRFGGLHGVIHAAGLIGPEMFRTIPEIGSREAEAHFRPKLRGAAVLARVLEEVEPDFCLMISSISTVLGGLGFAAYSAANLALDAFAQERDLAGGFPWMSVGWDAWAEREGEAPAGALGAELVELAMSPQEGLDVFARCLSLLGIPQLTVSTGDLEARARRWSARRSDAAAPAAEPAALHDRPNLPQPYVAPRDQTERTVAGLWQGLLGIQQIGVHDNFFELGGDSLRATQLASGLRRTFGVSLALRTLFDAPTVAGQALAVENLQAERTLADPPAESTIERGGQDIFDQLAELDGLSDEGIEALLAEDLATYGGME